MIPVLLSSYRLLAKASLIIAKRISRCIVGYCVGRAAV